MNASLYDGTAYDARLEKPGWSTPSYKPGSDWTPAVLTNNKKKKKEDEEEEEDEDEDEGRRRRRRRRRRKRRRKREVR